MCGSFDNLPAMAGEHSRSGAFAGRLLVFNGCLQEAQLDEASLLAQRLLRLLY